MFEFKANFPKQTGKKDKFRDKKADCRQRAKAIASPFNADNQARIKRIIFLKLEDVAEIQTIPKLYQHSHFQIYPSDYRLPIWEFFLWRVLPPDRPKT